MSNNTIKLKIRDYTLYLSNANNEYNFKSININRRDKVSTLLKNNIKSLYHNNSRLQPHKLISEYTTIKDGDILESNSNPLILVFLLQQLDEVNKDNKIDPSLRKTKYINLKTSIKDLINNDIPYLNEDNLIQIKNFLRKVDINRIKNQLLDYRNHDIDKEDPIEHYIRRVYNIAPPFVEKFTFEITMRSGAIIQSSNQELLNKLLDIEKENQKWLKMFPNKNVPILPRVSILNSEISPLEQYNNNRQISTTNTMNTSPLLSLTAASNNNNKNIIIRQSSSIDFSFEFDENSEDVSYQNITFPIFQSICFGCLAGVSIHNKRFIERDLATYTQPFTQYDMKSTDFGTIKEKLSTIIETKFIGYDSDFYFQSGYGKQIGKQMHDFWFERGTFLKHNQLSPHLAQREVIIIIDNSTAKNKPIEKHLHDLMISTSSKKMICGDFSFSLNTGLISEDFENVDIFPFMVERVSWNDLEGIIFDRKYKKHRFLSVDILNRGGLFYIIEGSKQLYTGVKPIEELVKHMEELITSQNFHVIYSESMIETTHILAMFAHILKENWNDREHISATDNIKNSIKMSPLMNRFASTTQQRSFAFLNNEFLKEFIFSETLRNNTKRLIKHRYSGADNSSNCLTLAFTSVSEIREDLDIRLNNLMNDYIDFGMQKKTTIPIYYNSPNLLKIDHIDWNMVVYYLMYMQIIFGVKVVVDPSSCIMNHLLNGKSQDTDLEMKLEEALTSNKCTYNTIIANPIVSSNRDLTVAMSKYNNNNHKNLTDDDVMFVG